MSPTGIHQGCPLGPVGFALAIQPTVERLQRESGLVWNSWYLDDGLLVGTASAVQHALSTLKTDLERIGLHINAGKCEVWGPDAQTLAHACPGIPCVPWRPDTGFTVLGIPVCYPGSHAYARGAWAAVNGRLETAVDLVTGLADAQLAHHLVRSCLDGCKVNHLLRASDCYGGVDDEVRRSESILLDGFADILGCSLGPHQMVQAGLPLSVGGCGLRCATVMKPAARLAALASFYSRGRHDVGLPDYCSQVVASWVLPPAQEAMGRLGPNFDPLVQWCGDVSAIAAAEPTHLLQK